MDLVVGLPECEGFGAIRVVVGRLLKMIYCVPCSTTIDAVELAKLFV